MMTIQKVIQTILSAVPDAATTETVDTVKTGDASAPVTGIVTTFLASQFVLQKAVELGANFVITHEPTFYNHLDAVDWLEGDPVYQAKRKFIDDNRLVIWRFHDNWHIHRPDGLLTGFVKDMDWEAYINPEEAGVYRIPPVSLLDLARAVKEKLGIRTLRLVGDPALTVSRVGVLVGAWGGNIQIPFWRDTGVDVLIVGEISEWETSEYARDAIIQGRAKALLITGHANSEEPGMKFLAEWLRPRFPGIPIHHVPTGDPFLFL